MNWLATKHDARRDGGSRSYRVRVEQVGMTRGMVPHFVTIECSGKPAGLQSLLPESPG